MAVSKFFRGASRGGIRPTDCQEFLSVLIDNQDSNTAKHENIGEIIKGRGVQRPGLAVKGLPPGFVASHEVQYVTIDSGACDSISPPSMFKNTPCNSNHKDFGKTYAACGGETVTNMGLKIVKCLLPSDDENPICKSLKFQVGDLVTRGLLSVSQVCNIGAGVWFGPGPDF